MSDTRCDVIVVGGGPAGSVLSILLGRAGYSVRLFDSSRFPREKPCGEGLLPQGAEVLSDVGALNRAGGRRLAGVRYHVGDESLRAGFGVDEDGAPRFGLGQRRLHLDHALWTMASETPGVTALQGMRVFAPLVESEGVTGVLVEGSTQRARLVVAADGASSTMRRKLGLERVLRPRRVGIRMHCRLPPGQFQMDDIQVFLRKGYELYVTPLPDDEVVVAALAHGTTAGPNLRQAFRRWQRDEPLLRKWLADAMPCSETMGRAPLLKRTRGVPPNGLLLLGDANHSVDPVTAGGMSLALSSASILGKSARDLLSGSSRAKRVFLRDQARATRIHDWLGIMLRWLSQSPRAANSAKGVIQAHPETMDALLGLATMRQVG